MQKHLQKLDLDKLIKYGIAAILIAVPLYPKFPFLKVPGIYVSIRIEDFLILAVAILWILKNYYNWKYFWKNKIIRTIILFLAAGLLATASGIIFLHTVPGLIGILEWGRRVEYLTVFLIAMTSIKSQKDVEFYVKCVGIVITLVFLFGVGQKHFNFPVITTQNQEYSKGIALRYVTGTQLTSTFAGHYDLAAYVLITSPIFISILFLRKESLKKLLNMNEKLARAIILFIIAISFWLMVNAASRITAFSYVLSLSITLILLRKYKYILVVVITTVIFTFTTSNLFDRYLNIFNAIKDRLGEIIAPPVYAESGTVLSAAAPVQDLSTAIRFNVEWPRAIRAFLKNPILGTGYGSATLATDNDYLRILAETGILGAISFGMMFLRIISNFIMRAWSTNLLGKKEIDFRTAYLAGIMGAIPGVLLNAVFIDVFEASKFAISFWILVGLGIALIYEKI